jgi:DnaJ-class molecular chaperone
MPNKDYYKDLWVSKNATTAEIKKAYKKLAMKYHPDRNKWSKSAEAEFKKINEAYQTLGDETKRKNYDQFGSAEVHFDVDFRVDLHKVSEGLRIFFLSLVVLRPRIPYTGFRADFDFGDLFSQFGGTQSHTSRTGSRQKKQTEHHEEVRVSM